MKYPSFRILRQLTLLFTTIQAGILVANAADNALVWEKTEQHFDADFGQEEVEATYAFTNKSDSIITISNAEASCGCTVPTLEKTTYGPGESGELKAIFTIGSRQGMQHKTITVTSMVDGSDKQIVDKLQLEVDIPVPVTLKPRVRFWKLDSEAQTQEVRITLHEDMPMAISDIERKDPNSSREFNYTIETIEEAKEYVLKITPISSKEKSRDVLYLTSQDDEKGVLKSFPIYVYVR